VVAQPLRRAETLAIFWFLCGPFAARGAKGEAEYLSRWLGGTGERSTVGKQERREAGSTRSVGLRFEARTSYQAGSRNKVRLLLCLSAFRSLPLFEL
jgi:hypothetical protein